MRRTCKPITPLADLFSGLALSAVFFSCFAFSGCSVIGMAIGARIDARKPDTRSIGWTEIEAVNEGSTISVHCRDSTVYRGAYEGCQELEERDYIARYLKFTSVDSVGHRMPGWHDTMSISLQSGAGFVGPFTGFDYRIDSLKQEFGVLHVATYNHPLREIRLDSITSLSILHDGELTGADLTAWARSHLLPGRTSLVVITGRWPQLVPIDRVTEIGVPTAKHGMRNGLLIGLGVDVVVFVIAAVALQGLPYVGPIDFHL